jgi:sigma-E factor negative regulatory protein RseB
MPARTDALRLPVLLLLFAGGQVFADDQARQWLDEMSRALQTLNYDGTFVYLHNGKLEAMRVIHQADGDGERERLVSLTGSAREVLRDDKSVTCIMPDNKSVMVGQSRPRQPFPAVPRDLDTLLKYYRIETIGDDRMAGNMTRVVAIRPRDAYRYGYRFWIDKDSKMLLKSDLTGPDGKPIEQVMFTRIRVGKRIPESELQSPLSGDDYAWYRQTGGNGKTQQTPGRSRWIVHHRPAGFEMKHQQYRRMQPGSSGTEHMVFSDGLATVSVYIEAASGESEAFIGLSRMGAMNAFGAVVEGHQITVVGEVPAATVEMMARSVATGQVPGDD